MCFSEDPQHCSAHSPAALDHHGSAQAKLLCRKLSCESFYPMAVHFFQSVLFLTVCNWQRNVSRSSTGTKPALVLSAFPPSKPARPPCMVCYANTGIIIRIKSKLRIKLVKLVTEGVRFKPSVLTLLNNKMKLSFKHSHLEHLKLQVSILLTLNRKCLCSSTQQQQLKMSVFLCS